MDKILEKLLNHPLLDEDISRAVIETWDTLQVPMREERICNEAKDLFDCLGVEYVYTNFSWGLLNDDGRFAQHYNIASFYAYIGTSHLDTFLRFATKDEAKQFANSNAVSGGYTHATLINSTIYYILVKWRDLYYKLGIYVK